MNARICAAQLTLWLVCPQQNIAQALRFLIENCCMRIILASQSPRRQSLLAGAGLNFEMIPSPAEELHGVTLSPSALCEENARRKAKAVAVNETDAVVIGADTLVFLDREPLGKPRDFEEARAMLTALSGRAHQVITGVCVITPLGEETLLHDLTEVIFKKLTTDEIDRYLQHTTPLDKAGAYGIQDHGEWIIDHFVGSYDTVMGLPVAPILETLRQIGLRGGAN